MIDTTIAAAKPAPRVGFIGVRFGVFAQSLREQLKGYRIPGKAITILQADADAISRLRVRSIITESQADKAHEKLMKMIVAAIPRKKAP